MKIVIILSAILASGVSYAGGTIISGGLVDTKAIEINFYSPGNGIDTESRDKLIDFIASRLKGNGLVKVTAKILGFEGDTAYCLEFINSEVLARELPSLEDIVTKGNYVSGKMLANCE